MDNIRDGGLDQALRLSTRMLDAAGMGDWANVTTLQAQCDALLRHDHKADEATRTVLLELQRHHQSVTALAAQARDVIAQELGRHRHNHRALSAYLVSGEK
ncbi:flagellar protein FliT [Rhodanobacter sp. Col0626]|uniref:flagellar protein FliT n=1 Tax=Rhodanobacter sp. Col0626 TaxID=3415679 RepID=UPI003CED466A